MTTALSSLQALIDHTQSGQMPCLEGCDNYELSTVYAQTLRLMGFEAEVMEGSFKVLSKSRGIDTFLSLSGIKLPGEDVHFVSPLGNVGVAAYMEALVQKNFGTTQDMTWALSRIGPGSVPVQDYLNQNPPPPFLEAIVIGVALLESQQLEQSFASRPDQARPRF